MLNNGSFKRQRRGLIAGSDNSATSNVGMPGFISDDFEDNVHKFLRDTKAAGRSEHTIKYYRGELITFMRLLEKEGVTTSLRRITDDIITEVYIIPAMTNKRRNTAINARLRALRAFLNWCVRKGVIDESPMDAITLLKSDTPAIETFTREQLHELLRQPDLETFVGLRDYTIMVLFIETGIRLRELVDIRVQDVRWSDSQVLVSGKNTESRLVPIQESARKVLQRYMKIRGHSPSEYFFISQWDEQMGRRTVQQRMRKYGRMANITNVRCSPHTFRHTFAKMSIQNGADIFSLQQILGHSSMEMVRIYVNMFSGDVQEAHKKFSPIENLM